MSADPFFSIQTPLDASPARGQMRAANFKGFAKFVRKSDGDPRRILGQFGLQPSSVQSEDQHIDMRAFVDIFEHCSEEFSDRLFGLRLARYQTPDVFGCVTTLCRAAPDFRTALETFIEFLPVVHSPETCLELFEGRQVSEFRYGADTDFGICDQSKYQAVLLNLKLFREIGGERFQPSYVSLDVDVSSKEIADVEQMLGCRFFASPTNAVAFPSSFLSQPTVHANRLVFDLLRGYLANVKTSARTSLIERVEDYIRSSLASGCCSIARCAKRLGVSERTLQLHLNENGKRFSSMLEEERTVLARSYLERGNLSLDDIAVLLGYSEQSSFGRAFKRWTNVTPQQFREKTGLRLN
jgi:AraC-like DNA-binding protein